MLEFEKLEVWQKAMDWVEHIYGVSSTFPREERFGLTSQLQWAAVSIASNIAEGSGRVSDKDFARFVEVSYGSLMEAICQVRMAQRLGYLTEENLDKLQIDAEELARMLSGFRGSLKESQK